MIPADIFREIGYKSDWYSLINYCQTNKRYYQLCNDKFWQDKLERDIDKIYWKSSYSTAFLNYIASRNSYLIEWLEWEDYTNLKTRLDRNDLLGQYEILYFKLDRKWPSKIDNKEMKIYVEEHKIEVEEKRKESIKISNILINYLRKSYPNNFKVIFINLPTEDLSGIRAEAIRLNGIKDNLIVNRDPKTRHLFPVGYFLTDHKVEFKLTDNDFNIQFSSSFINLINYLGLKIIDSWKLYQIPENIRLSAGKYRAIYGQMNTQGMTPATVGRGPIDEEVVDKSPIPNLSTDEDIPELID